MATSGHIPVLLQPVVDLLTLTGQEHTGGVFADCTAGLGGHAVHIAARLGSTGVVILNDLDAGNLDRAAEAVRAALPGITILTHAGNFASLPRFIASHGLRATCVLADLGFASTQVDNPARGLSFMHDGPLDMRLDPAGPVTAADLVATMTEQELVQTIAEFGEEKHPKPIARRIVQARQQGAITTTAQLASIIRSALAGKPTGGIDPATRTFQALRIAVNDELGNLDALLDEISAGARALQPPGSTHTGPRTEWLAPGARVGIISFHSLEDRPVKHTFANLVKAGLARHVIKDPLGPTDDEQRTNPRSRSAKLRGIQITSNDSGPSGAKGCSHG